MKRAGLVVAVIVGSLSGVASAQETNVETFDLLAQAAARSHAGDHLGAIALYERAYRQDASMDLLVTIGSEYRKAGKTDEAIQNLCAYLAVEPEGEQAAFAASEVFSIEASLGRTVGGNNVCSPAEPMLPPIAPPTVRQGPPTTSSDLSQREIAGIATGAAGLIGLATGVVYGVRAHDISNEILDHDPATPWPANIKELEADGQHAETMQTMFLIGGAVATAAGVYLTVTGRSHRIANERITVSPALLQQGGGLAISGGF